jgi:hypothetical protein
MLKFDFNFLSGFFFYSGEGELQEYDDDECEEIDMSTFFFTSFTAYEKPFYIFSPLFATFISKFSIF